MSDPSGTRKLTAIMSADVYGYSRMMGTDEAETFKRLTACRETVFKLIREGKGRVANTAGDAVLAEFGSVQDAATSAVKIQRALAELNADVPTDRQMHFRVGLNLGDVYEQQGDLFGDGVNIAARIQSLADPGGIYLSASVYEQLVNKTDIPVEYVGEERLKNIEKPVRVYRVTGVKTPAVTTTPKPPERADTAYPSIVIGVMPFDNVSEDTSQQYFCDGLTEDLTSALAAMPQIKIVARNTMFGFKGKSLDIRQLGQDVGATHIVEGSVRKAGTKLRINVQLLETDKGNHLWAQRFDRELSDLFEMQDEIVRRVVTELDVRLVSGETARVTRAATRSVEAYDLFLQARGITTWLSPEAYDLTLSLLERAIAIDPDFGLAYAVKATTLLTQSLFGMSRNPAETMRQARLALDEMLKRAGDSPLAHAVTGMFLRHEKKFDQAKKEYELALSGSAGSPLVHSQYGWFCLQTKDYQGALAEARRARELAPFPPRLNDELEALALQFLGRVEEALLVVRRALRPKSRDVFTLVTYAVLAARVGLKEESVSACKKVLEIQPNFNAAEYARNSLDADTAPQYAETLHQMGLP